VRVLRRSPGFIDVEGHELAVLNGRAKTLSSPEVEAVIMTGFARVQRQPTKRLAVEPLPLDLAISTVLRQDEAKIADPRESTGDDLSYCLISYLN